MTLRHDLESQPRRSSTPAAKRGAVDKAVAALLSEHGASEALKRAQFRLRLARRARSRKEYAFWAVVGMELASRQFEEEQRAIAQEPAGKEPKARRR